MVKLNSWVKENKMIISGSKIEDSDIIEVEEFGTFLYLKPFDGKVIDEDFAFILSDVEFDLLDEKNVDFILFEFGEKFYYSTLNPSKNKYNELIYKPSFLDFKYLGKSSEQYIFDSVHLGVHSEYEILNGSGNCDLWVKKAKFLGCKALGICDRDTMAGTLAFQSACEKKGIKSIIGETVTVARNYSPDKDIQETFELKFYIMNYEGWKNLLLINKAVNVDYIGYIPDSLLYTLGAGLTCVIPKESELNYIKDNRKEALKLITKYRKSFQEVFYQIDTVEYSSGQLFQRHLSNLDTYILNYRKFIKPISINDSYYLDKEESGLKLMLNKISKKVLPESGNQYFKSVGDTIDSYEEWLDDVEPLFEVITTGIINASELVDKIDFKINTGERKLPHFEVKNVEGMFFDELEKGISERLGHLPADELAEYIKRIEIECSVIVPNGLSDYFMILWDVIKWCKTKDINVGTGRGSVCGSLVAYVLHITDVDPLKYGLMFSRFLNEARMKIPVFFEVELEDGEVISIPEKTKIPLLNGKFIVIDMDLDFTAIDIDIDKLKELLK